MPDEFRSPVKHHLVLHRRDPEQRIARFYSLMIERDLFGRVVLVRNWGRIGTNGQERHRLSGECRFKSINRRIGHPREWKLGSWYNE